MSARRSFNLCSFWWSFLWLVMVKKLLHCVGADLTNETSVYIIWCLFKAIRRDGRWNSFRLIIWANSKKQLFETLHISTDKVLGGVGLMRTDVGHTQRCTDLELFHCLLDIRLSWLGYWETCFLACLLQRDLSGFVRQVPFDLPEGLPAVCVWFCF